MKKLSWTVGWGISEFAENYSFIVQDKVKLFTRIAFGAHCINVIYYFIDNLLTHKPFCIISDDMTHDADVVHEVQNVIRNIKN